MRFIVPIILLVLLVGPELLLQYWAFKKRIVMKKEEWVGRWGQIAGTVIAISGAFFDPPSQLLIYAGLAITLGFVASYRVYLNWKDDAREIRIAYCGQVVAAIAAVLGWKYPALLGGRLWAAVCVFFLSGAGWLLAWCLWNRHGRNGGERASWQGRFYLGLFLLSTAVAVAVTGWFARQSWPLAGPLALFLVPAGLLIAHWAVPASIRRREKKKPNVEESRA